MPVFTCLRRRLTTLRGWWRREVEALANAAPYPLTQDEWEFIQGQEAVRFQRKQVAAKTTSYINEQGYLVGLDSGSGAG